MQEGRTMLLLAMHTECRMQECKHCWLNEKEGRMDGGEGGMKREGSGREKQHRPTQCEVEIGWGAVALIEVITRTIALQ